MPSKGGANVVAEANSEVLLLINLIRTAAEFKPDMKEMAKLCNIAYEKNVSRKINAVVTQHGFKFERGSIIELNGGATDKDQDEDGEKVEASAKPTKKAPNTTKGKKPKTLKSNKKRKFEEEMEEPEDEKSNVVKEENESAIERGDNSEDGGASDEDRMKLVVE